MKNQLQSLAHLEEHFIQFIEEYRNKKSRRDARVVFRLELGLLGDRIPESVVTDVLTLQRNFINNYSNWKNFFKKKKIRTQTLNSFNQLLTNYYNR